MFLSHQSDERSNFQEALLDIISYWQSRTPDKTAVLYLNLEKELCFLPLSNLSLEGKTEKFG